MKPTQRDRLAAGPRMTRRAVLPPLAAALLSGCSSSQNLLGDLLGESDNTVLPGKRESLFAPGAGAGQASEPVAIPPARVNAAWPQPGGNAANVGQNLALGRPLRRIYSVSAAAGSDSAGRLAAPPIVVGGRVHVLDAKATVRTFSAGSGGRLWRVSLVPKGEDADDGYGGGVCSDGRAIYVATGFGEVFALNPANGGIIWKRKTGLPFRSAPMVFGGRVHVRDSGNVLHVLSPASGEEQWRHEGKGAATSLISASAPAAGGGIIVAPFSSGEIIAFSPQGYEQWSADLAGADAIRDVAARPVIHGRRVFAASVTGALAAFDLRSGEELWSADLGGRNTPWLAGDYLFHISGRNRLSAVSAASGGLRWSVSLPRGSWSGPVMGGGRLIAVSSEGHLAEISPQDGQRMNRIKLPAGSYISPVIAGGVLFVLDDEGNLTTFR